MSFFPTKQGYVEKQIKDSAPFSDSFTVHTLTMIWQTKTMAKENNFSKSARASITINITDRLNKKQQRYSLD